MAVKTAYYKIYNGTGWDTYYFATSAGQVGVDGSRKFLSSSVTINGVPFVLANDNTEVATLTLTPADIGAAPAVGGGYVAKAGDTMSGALNFSANDVNRLDISTTTSNSTIHTNTGLLKIQSEGSGGNPGTVEMFGDLRLYKNSAYKVTVAVNTNQGSNVTYTLPAKTNDDTFVMQSDLTSAISALPTPMQFKGTVGDGGTYEWANLPSASGHDGWTLKAISVNVNMMVKAGDTLVSNGTDWIVIPSGDEPSGTVTNIATGTGLIGGPITSSGTISLDTSYLSNNYVSKAGDEMSGSLTMKNVGIDFNVTASGGFDEVASIRSNVYSSADDTVTLDFEANSGRYKFKTDDVYYGTLDFSGVNSNSTYTFPSGGGTLATQSWANNKFAQVVVQTGSTEPTGTFKAGDIWIN